MPLPVNTHMAQVYAGDVLSLGAIVISWTGVLQPLAAFAATLVAVLWYGIQIYESRTVQKRLRAKRITRRRKVRHHKEEPHVGP